ncbi:polynucleotide kinase-phosphatase [Paenibacillus sp. Leaf72]|uniref:polynucleotide kinase-phosphatase n=1 Tax=Paenibacillus sp. Leaf72 TaxID=1736234 RepID=UPI0006F45192|nr:polynucleotide kinase-phosphatase [Paenibacillus sp. Leaf72]KQO12038.1 polynucleotide kinase-phosphatase [Paenibacillus sp. Leaf72]
MSEQGKRVIRLPHAGIVLLVGPSNSGKTTLLQTLIAAGKVKQTEVVSSDQFRMLVGDVEFMDWTSRSKLESDIIYKQYQHISAKAFEAMEGIIAMRCRLDKLTLIDATHLYEEDRKRYVELARKQHVPVVALVLDTPEEELLRRDSEREFPRGKQRVKKQAHLFKRSLRSLKLEGFDASYVIKAAQLINIAFERKANPLVHEVGQGIDIIGDVHGCFQEQLELLGKLGYAPDEAGLFRHPEGRIPVSVGDVMSRGPESLAAMEWWRKHVEAGLAYMTDSNHGWKLARFLDGRQVELSHGDEKTAAELVEYEREHGEEAANMLKERLRVFLLQAPPQLVFCCDGVRQLVVVHAGIRDSYIGKQSAKIQDYCRYGESDGTDAQGKPLRKEWYNEHESGELIVWGHDPRVEPTITNQTINIDQGVVFGGHLTAYRYPEKQFVQVKARENYAGEARNPLLEGQLNRFKQPNLRKYIEGYSVLTSSYGDVAVRGEFVKAAIDTVSHFTVPLEELVYIPPTMSPPPMTAEDERFLEHPVEAFAYYRSQGVEKMIMEKKHMGSRAIVLLFRNEAAAVPYVGRETLGVIYTRTGRAFFQSMLQEQVLRQLNGDLTKAEYFDRYGTDLVLLDTEIVPWNLKARELIASQYAHVAEASLMDRRAKLAKLREAKDAGKAVQHWIDELEIKLDNAETFDQAFQQYCWDTNGLEGIRIAPFHTLAHSTASFQSEQHSWHMEHARELAACSELFMETEYKVVTDETSELAAIRWWEEMTEQGHEGAVIKPEYFVARHKGRLIQPAIKVRGRKYLHIIYGMDYLLPENLQRLKQRKTSKKERYALKEFALGLESVERFIRKESVDRIHECVLAALSMESDSVDPRL